MGAKVIAGVVAEFNPFHSGPARRGPPTLWR